MVLNGVFVASVGLNNNTEYYKLKSTGSDLDRSRLTRYPIRRKLLDRSRYRSSVSDRCIPNRYTYVDPYVLRPIETVANEESMYIYIYISMCQSTLRVTRQLS